MRLMMVDLPDPDGPTSAVTVPGCDSKLTSYSTGFPGSYEKLTCSKAMSPRIMPTGWVLFGSSFSGFSCSTSWVRSRPASASVNCVPMPTTWNMGATSMARNMVNDMNSPIVSVWAMICRAPTYITVPPTIPISEVAERLISEIAVSDFSTLSSSRCTPAENTPASSSSAWYPFTTPRTKRRSEEHTSELQSLRHLVCRLLL